MEPEETVTLTDCGALIEVGDALSQPLPLLICVETETCVGAPSDVLTWNGITCVLPAARLTFCCVLGEAEIENWVRVALMTKVVDAPFAKESVALPELVPSFSKLVFTETETFTGVNEAVPLVGVMVAKEGMPVMEKPCVELSLVVMATVCDGGFERPADALKNKILGWAVGVAGGATKAVTRSDTVTNGPPCPLYWTVTVPFCAPVETAVPSILSVKPLPLTPDAVSH